MIIFADRFIKQTLLLMKKIFTCCLLGFALSAMAQTSEQFSVATLNVDGLPKKILVFNVNADGPGDAGTSRIGKYFVQKSYDMVFMQEDFNYHEVLKVWLEDDYKLDEWTGDVEVLDHNIDFLHLQNHRFTCDGLMGCWKNDLTVTANPRTAWKENFGKFSHALDELVTKGFRRYEAILRGGQGVVVYNMHMDASDDADVDDGNDTKDKAARLAQWMQLKEDILSKLDSRPVIIVGDVNTLYKRDNVKKQFIDAINESGRATVSDVFIELKKGSKYPEYDPEARVKDEDLEVLDGETLDKILYINPTAGTQLKAISFNVDKDGYMYDGKPLGDHYPLSATFEVAAQTSSINTLPINMENASSNKELYDLSGRKVSQPHRGLYIEHIGEKTNKRIIR